MHAHPGLNRGFTLIELSIVLVIIGLITGAIIGGEALLRQAELQNIIKEAGAYRTAYNSFKVQYNALPGDFKNASQYWTGANIGNGDGNIDYHSTNEYLQAWEHLADAGMISGSYTGQPSGGQTVAGVNAPIMKVKGVACVISTTEPGSLTYGHYGVRLQCGGVPHGDLWPEDPITTAAESKNIDLKIDDGVPNKGNFYTRKAFTYNGSGELSGCVDQSSTVDASTTVNYTLSGTTRQCELVFWLE